MYFGSSNTPAQGLAAAQPKKTQTLGLALQPLASQPAPVSYKPAAPAKGYALANAAGRTDAGSSYTPAPPMAAQPTSPGGGERESLMAARKAYEALAETFRGSPMEAGYRGMVLDINNKIAAIPAQPVVGSFGSPAAAPRAGASQYTPVPAPRTGAGLISGGPADNQVRGAFAGQNAAGVAPTPRVGLETFDPFAYNRQALSGLAGATKRLEDLANPYADPSGQQALGLAGARRALDSQGARDSIHGRNDAINRMMAGGGLLAQQDLNALSDNVRAGVMNQQAGLAADYANRSVDWETQRRQEVARQYERQAGLASSPFQLSQEQLRAEEAEQRLWETRMSAPDRLSSAQWQAESQRLGVDAAGLDNAIRRLDVGTKTALYETVIEQGKAEGRISKAEADAAEQLMRQGGEWYENPLLKNILRAVLIGGGAVGGALIGGPPGAYAGGLGGAALGAGVGAAAASGIR